MLPINKRDLERETSCELNRIEAFGHWELQTLEVVQYSSVIKVILPIFL